MLIENVDALKTWLTKSLTPICDADPTALAKYVVALIKKDKTEAELKDSCNDQLDVFLQKDTKSFVDNFFEVLKNKSYIKETEAPPTVTSTTSTRTSESKNDTKRSKSKERKKSESEPVDDDERDFRRRRSRSGSPRGRSSERRRFDDRPRRGYDRDRRRDRLDDRRRSRSRSRSPWRPTDRGPRRSPEKEGAHPEFDARNYRVPDGNHSGPPVAPPPPDSRGADWNRDGYRGEQRPPPPPRRPRCRDYDEKGFCMRGDMCPFDHGVDPVIVEDVNLPNVLAFPGPNQTAPGGPPVGQGPRGPPPGPMPRGPPPPQMRPQPPPPGTGGMPQHMHHGMPPRPNMPHPPRQGPPPGPPQGQGPRPMMGNRNEPYEPEPYNPEAPNLSGRRPPPPGPGQHGHQAQDSGHLQGGHAPLPLISHKPHQDHPTLI